MPANRQQLFARLEDLGIASVTVEHEAVFTVEQSTALAMLAAYGGDR